MSDNETTVCVGMFSLQSVPHMALLFFPIRKKKKVNLGGHHGN